MLEMRKNIELDADEYDEDGIEDFPTSVRRWMNEQPEPLGEDAGHAHSSRMLPVLLSGPAGE